LSYRLRVSRRAESQIRVASDWWLENRPKAPQAFSEEIERAFDLVRALPSVGEPVAHLGLKGVRRVLLGRIRYYLYYQAFPAMEIVEVLALWHTSRGKGPGTSPPR
jgi:plasmid stabilization system protein ParE